MESLRACLRGLSRLLHGLTSAQPSSLLSHPPLGCQDISRKFFRAHGGLPSRAGLALVPPAGASHRSAFPRGPLENRLEPSDVRERSNAPACTLRNVPPTFGDYARPALLKWSWFFDKTTRLRRERGCCFASSSSAFSHPHRQAETVLGLPSFATIQREPAKRVLWAAGRRRRGIGGELRGCTGTSNGASVNQRFLHGDRNQFYSGRKEVYPTARGRTMGTQP